MNTLPFKEGDVVCRTAIDHAPGSDEANGISEGSIGVIAGIDYRTPMFTVVFPGGFGDAYLIDEIELWDHDDGKRYYAP